MKLKAEQFARIRNYHGRWYVYVDDGSELGKYLHKDGQVRDGTQSEAGWTGYYENEIEANGSISKYLSNLQEATK